MTEDNQNNNNDNGGIVGDETYPVDVFHTIEEFLDLFRKPQHAPMLYAGTIELETDDGTLVFNEEDGCIRVEWEPS